MLIDLIKKYIPLDTELWSPLCGYCTLARIDQSSTPKYFVLKYYDREISLNSSGKYYHDGELMIFPNKNIHSWQILEFINNDAKNGALYEFRDAIGNIYIGRFNKIEEGAIYFYYFINSCDQITRNGRFKISELVNMYEPSSITVKNHANVLNCNKLCWDGGELVSTKPEFKILQKVLGRYTTSDPWRIDLFSHMTCNNKYVCLGGIYSYCIPYKGNEYLVNKV